MMPECLMMPKWRDTLGSRRREAIAETEAAPKASTGASCHRDSEDSETSWKRVANDRNDRDPKKTRTNFLKSKRNFQENEQNEHEANEAVHKNHPSLLRLVSLGPSHSAEAFDCAPKNSKGMLPIALH